MATSGSFREGTLPPTPASARSGSLSASLTRSRAVSELMRTTYTRTQRSTTMDGDYGDALLSPSGGGSGGGSAWWNPRRDAASSLHLLTSSWLNLLLLVVPAALASEALHWSPSTVFLLNLLGLVPLALLLGEVTEDLALRLGETIGGLLNATFGNVVEVILSIAALQQGLYDVVATSLLGSVLSNLLLVLGMSFFVGGLKYKVQRFNAVASQTSGSLLLLSAIAIVIPTAAQHLGTGGGSPARAALALLAGGAPAADAAEQLLLGAGSGGGMAEDKILLLSRLTAVALLIVYGAYLLFQLGTHHDLFSGDDNGGGHGGEHGGGGGGGFDNDDGGPHEEPLLTLTAAGLWLAGITVLVAVLSEFLTGSIEEVSTAWGLSRSFLGFIVLPIAGNACEHITAVFVAAKDKMDLSLGVAIGSSVQIGLFAVPFVTIVGWALGHPFSLGLDPFAALVLLLSVMHACHMLGDAESHWLEGLQLIVTYFIVSVAYALSS